MVEQRTENPRVSGSTPLLGTIEFGAPRLAPLGFADLSPTSLNGALIVLEGSDV